MAFGNQVDIRSLIIVKSMFSHIRNGRPSNPCFPVKEVQNWLEDMVRSFDSSDPSLAI